MPGSSNGSFIPKRNPVKRSRKSASRKVYAVTFVSYILIFATLLASAGVFMYNRFIDKQLETSVTVLNNEINNFDENEMQEVRNFDLRLKQVSDRVSKNISIASLFDSLEKAVVGKVQFLTLNIDRVGDVGLELEASVMTDSFDSSLFQRDIFEKNSDIFSSVSVNSVELSEQNNSDNTENQGDAVTFKAELTTDLESVLYSPSDNISDLQDDIIEEDISSETELDDTQVNQPSS